VTLHNLKELLEGFRVRTSVEKNWDFPKIGCTAWRYSSCRQARGVDQQFFGV